MMGEFMRTKNYALKGLLMLSLMLMIMSTQVLAIKTEDIEVQVVLGYDKTVKIGEGNPVEFRVTNHGEDFSGEVQVYIEGQDGNYTIYAKAFDLANNSTKTIELTVPLNTIQRSFDVAIASNKKTLYEETIKINEVYPPESAAIGVITDNPDQYRFLANLNYLNTSKQFNYDYYPMRTTSSVGISIEEPYTSSVEPNAVFLDNYLDMLTTERLAYFDYIYMGRIDSLDLTDMQIESLLKWIEGGGVMVIESGNQYQKTEQLIAEQLKVVKFTDIEPMAFDSYYEGMPIGGSIMVAKIDQDTIVEEQIGSLTVDDRILGYYKSIGLGKVVELSIDFGTAPLNTWSGKTVMFEELMNQLNTNQAFQDYYYEDMYQYQNYLMNVPSKSNAPYTIMLIILGLYILATGPILYFLLKKRDKRTAMWWMIPLFSVVSVIAFFLIGFTTRYTKPITNNISTITYEAGDDVALVETYMSVLSNKKGDLTINWDSEDAFEVQSETNYGYYDETAVSKVVAKLTQGNRTTYTLYDAGVWDGNYLQTSKIIDFEANDMVNITVKGSDLVIEVTNNLPITLEYAYIKWGNYYVDLGTIEPGQSISKTELLANSYFASYYEFDERRFGYLNYGQLSKSTDLSDNYLLRDILNMKYNSYVDPQLIELDAKKVTLVAINEDSMGYDLIINDSDYESFNTNIIEINTSITYEPGTSVVFDRQTLTPKVQLAYDDSFNQKGYIDYNSYDQLYYINEFGIIEFTYELPVDIDLEKLYIEMPMVTTSDNYYNKQGNGTALLGQIASIYSTANDDFIPFTADISTTSDDYLKNGNQIVIRIDTRSIDYDTQQGWVEMILPSFQIQIEGVVKGEDVK